MFIALIVVSIIAISAVVAAVKLYRRVKVLEKDNLTSLYNRHYVEEWADRRHKAKRGFAVMFLDVDHFKTINDTYGHHVGDKCLREIALQLPQICRQEDRASRYGGDEFIVLVDSPDEKSLSEAAKRIKKAVSEIDLGIRDEAGAIVHVTVSVGYAIQKNSMETLEDLSKQADLQMYKEKQARAS